MRDSDASSCAGVTSILMEARLVGCCFYSRKEEEAVQLREAGLGLSFLLQRNWEEGKVKHYLQLARTLTRSVERDVASGNCAASRGARSMAGGR